MTFTPDEPLRPKHFWVLVYGRIAQHMPNGGSEATQALQVEFRSYHMTEMRAVPLGIVYPAYMKSSVAIRVARKRLGTDQRMDTRNDTD